MFPPPLVVHGLFVALVAQSAATDGAKRPVGVAPGTKRMAERLADWWNTVDPEACPFLNVERVPLYQKKVERAVGSERESDLRLKLAIELMQAGDPEAALAELDRAAAAAKSLANDRQAFQDIDRQIERTRALAWMRVGEIENCLGHHCCQSCIVPIAAGGVHGEPRGSQNAIPILERLLSRDPNDWESKWLVNLAHMTLGQWPDGVRKEWLFGPELFASEYELPRFPDVASDCGLAISTLSGGCCLEDFDRDGFIDVMLSSIGMRDPMHYFHSNGDGTFTERTDEAGLTGLVGGLNMFHGDYDNDGWPDVYVLRGAWYDEAGEIPDSLLRNRGDGTFEDVTEQAGLLSFRPSQAGEFADFDGDGWLDIVIGNETQHDERPNHCELFHSNRDGTFTDVAKAVGGDLLGFCKGVAVGDFDDDGRPDLYYSIRAGNNKLMRNVPDDTPGGPGFKLVDVTAEARVAMPNMSFPTWFFDYDNDGRLDLFVAANTGFGAKKSDGIGEFMAGKSKNMTEVPQLYHNDGNGKFTEVGKKLKLARAILVMGSNFGDFDNDGWLDMYLGDGAPSFAALLPNRAFRNDRGQGWQDVTTTLGVGHLQKGHAIAFADLDNDGDQDIYHEVGGFFSADIYPNVLFENPGNANHWITLRLEGVKANRSAIGARIRVDVATPAGDRSMHLVCGTGGSFGSSSLQQEIGLGDATAVKQIFIRWPGSDTRQTLTGAQLDRVYRIVEGKDALEEVKVKRFKLGAK